MRTPRILTAAALVAAAAAAAVILGERRAPRVPSARLPFEANRLPMSAFTCDLNLGATARAKPVRTRTSVKFRQRTQHSGCKVASASHSSCRVQQRARAFLLCDEE